MNTSSDACEWFQSLNGNSGAWSYSASCGYKIDLYIDPTTFFNNKYKCDKCNKEVIIKRQYADK